VKNPGAGCLCLSPDRTFWAGRVGGGRKGEKTGERVASGQSLQRAERFGKKTFGLSWGDALLGEEGDDPRDHEAAHPFSGQEVLEPASDGGGELMQGEHPGDPDPGEDKGGRTSLPLPFPDQKVGVKDVVATEEGHYRCRIDEGKGCAVEEKMSPLPGDSRNPFQERLFCLRHILSRLRQEGHR